MSADNKPVKLKIYPIYGYYGIERSRNCCGACNAIVPDGVTHCPSCGVPIYGRIGEGSYSKCKCCGAYIPNAKGLEKCPSCREPIS